MLRNSVFIVLLFFASGLYAQEVPPSGDVYVDNGILRWKENNSEVSLFGVNYTAPFAYSFRAMKKLNINIKEAIDIDVYHMKRLGFNAFRVHVWDREVSDSSGNLLQNEHLDLLDYLLKKLSDNNIKTILTPIAWWGTGWPEPDPVTPGFSQKYSKVELITVPAARAAQRNYLDQFINHVNHYTRLKYKDDPSVIAWEIINEPKHPKDTAAVTEYINEMYDVLRRAGLSKPIFYNISENWSDHHAAAVSRSEVQGVSFQWYPTALVHDRMLGGNYLLNVSHYTIPGESIKGFSNKAKMIYEFDAADIGGSYMYPAMARSFREAGMQFAAMFSYDPANIAWSNTEYPTHFVNLLYAPSKAISLMIAAKAFRTLPLNKSYGEYPANNTFSVFRVSYEQNLSEMNTPEEYFYSNNTVTEPAAPGQLEHIAGFGSSPLIKYNGTGAYFLDKQNDGSWVLEVNPDAVWVRDPFAKAGLSREVSKLFFSESEMIINLPSLNPDYYCFPLYGKERTQASGRKINILPGVYILSNSTEVQNIEKLKSDYKEFDYYIPSGAGAQESFVVNETPAEVIAEDAVHFRFTIASAKTVNEAKLFIRKPGWRGYESHKLFRKDKYTYAADVNSEVIKSALIEYCVCLYTDQGPLTFPGPEAASPDQWDFSSENLWKLKIITKGDALTLFSAERDYNKIVYPHFYPRRYYADIKTESGELIYSCRVEFQGITEYPFGIMSSIPEYLKVDSLRGYNKISVTAGVPQSSGADIYLNLLMNDGSAYRVILPLQEQITEQVLSLSTFTPCDRLILPDSYPQFFSKISKKKNNNPIDLSKLEFIQFTIEEKNITAKGSSFILNLQNVKLIPEDI